MPSGDTFIFVNYERSLPLPRCLTSWWLRLGETNYPFLHSDFTWLLELCVLGKFIPGYGDAKKVGFVEMESKWVLWTVFQIFWALVWPRWDGLHSI